MEQIQVRCQQMPQTKAKPGELAIGEFVYWLSGNQEMYGQITEIEFEDEAENGQDIGPKAKILVYMPSGASWEPSEMTAEVMFIDLAKIDPLRSFDKSLITGVRLREILGDRRVESRMLPGGLTVEKQDNGELTFSFSSEEPVQRWFGTEVLSHDPGAMDLSRANDGAPYLWNHDRDVVLGKLEKAWLGADRKCYTKPKWSRNTEERGSVEWKRRNDIEDGTCRNVSFAYEIIEMKEMSPDNYLITKWNVLEVSSVSVPADQTVGLGRAADSIDSVILEPETGSPAGTAQAAIAASPNTKTMTEANDSVTLRQQAVTEERNRIENVRAMCERFEVKDELRDKLINEGTSLEDACVEIREASPKFKKVELSTGSHHSGADLLGMDQKEIQRYSILKLIRAITNPQDLRAQQEASYELSVSRDYEKLTGQAPKGHYVPADVLGDRQFARAVAGGQNVGVFADGGALVATDYLSGSFVDLLKNQSSIMALNPTILSGLVGNVEIPKKTGKSTYYFIGEDVDINASKLQFGMVNMTPKTIAVRVPISRQTMLQTTPAVEGLVRTDIIEEVALGMDATAVYGTGSSSRPLGLSNIPGIGAVSMSGGTSKTFPADLGGGSHDCGDWSDYVDLETAIYATNANVAGMAYLGNSVVRGALKQTLRASTAGSDFIMRDDGSVNGYNFQVSNQIQTNDVFFGNFSDAVIGLWGGLDMTIDPYTQAASGQVVINVFQSFDFAVRRAQSFAKGT